MRIAIAEDAVILRTGLVEMLETRGHLVVAAVGDGSSLLNALPEVQCDIAILDVRMPPTFSNEGVVAALAIRQQFPDVGVLLFSQYIETHYAAQLLSGSSGHIGYLLKERVADVGAFIESLQRVADGETVLDPDVVRQVIAVSHGRDDLESLTAREHEVLSLMAEGWSNAGIAKRLVVSERAVEKHVANVLSKLDLPPSPEEHRRVLAVLQYLDRS